MESIRIDNEEGNLMNSRTEFGANSVPRISAQQPNDNHQQTTNRRIREGDRESNDQSVDAPQGNSRKRLRTENSREQLVPPTVDPGSSGTNPGHLTVSFASIFRKIGSQRNETRVQNSDGEKKSKVQDPNRNFESATLSPMSATCPPANNTPRTNINSSEPGREVMEYK